MNDLWRRFEKVFSKYPSASEALNPAASLSNVNILEKNLSISLPGDYKESLLIHDGQSGEQFLFGWRLWPLNEVAHTALSINKGEIDCSDDSGYIKDCIANPNWIYIADNGGSGFLALDLDPGFMGSVGQLIAIYEDDIELVANSFRSFMENTVSDIESGKLVWDEAGCFIPASELEENSVESSKSHADFLALREQSPSYDKVKNLKTNELITLVGTIKVNKHTGKHAFYSLGYSLELSGNIPSTSSNPKMVSITIKAGKSPFFGFGKRNYDIISHEYL